MNYQEDDDEDEDFEGDGEGAAGGSFEEDGVHGDD